MVPPLGLGMVGNSLLPSWNTTELSVPVAKLVPPVQGTDVPGVAHCGRFGAHEIVMLDVGFPPPWPPLQAQATHSVRGQPGGWHALLHSA